MRLITPRPLGPLLDIAQLAGGELQERVESGASPHQVATALLHELATRLPTVLVLEDVHWADEATLDAWGSKTRSPEPSRVELAVG
jgi:hypothetical protein